MIVPFPPWRPDTAEIGGDGTVALGVVPGEVEQGGITYHPFPQFAALIDTALAAECRGAGVFLDAGDDTHLFAGTSTKLYKENGGSWDDVTRASGGDHSLAGESIWKFARISVAAEDLIIAFGDADEDLQVYDINSSTDFAQLSSDAPRAKCGAVVDGNILLVGNTWDATDGYVSNRVWWHGRNSLTGAPKPASWPTPGSSTAQEEQSDFRDLDTNGSITAICGPLGGSVGGMVFAQKSIHRVAQTAPIGYSFYKITEDIGCAAPNSVVTVRGRAYFLSDDGFYATDGQSVVPIGSQKVDSWLYGVIDEGKLHKVFGALVPRSKLVVWAFASTSGGGHSDYALAYNYEIGEFSLIASDLALEFLMPSLSIGYTEEGLAALYTLWEDVPFSADSPVWKGGRPFLAGFGSDHKYGAFSGANLAVRIETGELAQDGNQSFMTTGIRPLIEAGTELTSGQVTCSVGYRSKPNGAPTYTTASSINDEGICPQRIGAKFQRARIDISAGVDWAHARGAEYEFVMDGRR